MSSKNRSKVARRNGAKAAGTKSPAGIQQSAKNATKHGLLAKTLVLANESQAKFDELLQSYVDRFQPKDQVEMGFVNEMVAARWRQQRLWTIQTSAIDLEMYRMQPKLEETMLECSEATRISIAFTAMANQEKALELLMRYETSYSRMHDRAMKSLQSLQQSIFPNDPKPPGIGVDPRSSQENNVHQGNHQHNLTEEDAVLPPRRMFRKTEAERSDDEWAYVRMAILDALRPFPGAREAVVSTLIERSLLYEKGEEVIDGDV